MSPCSSPTLSLPLDATQHQASPERSRFLSEADCRDIARRLARYARGGGESDFHIISRWTGHVRWARNRITQTGEDRDNRVRLTRLINGAEYNGIYFNEVSDRALVAATRRAERLISETSEHVHFDLGSRPGSPFRFQGESVTTPNLFFESTYQQDAGTRAETARHLIRGAEAAGMLSAGYIQVSATSFALLTSWGYVRYYQYTWAQASMTVRDPTGVGSGWAGVDWPDWNRIDGKKLADIALEKCLASRNPVAIEPGRYTTILEPQAVCDLVSLWGVTDPRGPAEEQDGGWFHKSGKSYNVNVSVQDRGFARFGERVMDERLTLSADPLDPDLGFPPYHPFNWSLLGPIYRPITYVERGVLRDLGYDLQYATMALGKDASQSPSGALRISVNGPTSSIAEMITTTIRGLLVTRFSNLDGPYGSALMCRGYTRDGLWLIEHGKISKPVKNMVFTESIQFVLNNVEQIGEPQRAFHPTEDLRLEFPNNPQPYIVPALKIKDFSFTAITDAI